jgi:hypothetical protein
VSDLLDQLVEDGLLKRVGERYRTTRRWQSAMSRAAIRLAQRDDDGSSNSDDLRVPIALALLDFYGDAADDELVALVEALTPIEAAELAPPTTVVSGASEQD